MKRSIFLLMIFIVTHMLYAGETYRDGFLPKWLTEEEKSRLHEIDYEREPTEPPPQPSRSVAEYEPMSAVLIRYPLGIPIALVALLSEEIEVISIVADHNVQNQAISSYQNNGVNLDNCSFLIAQTNSIWTRDYGPWFIFNGEHEIGIVDFEYDRPRPQDSAIPGIFADENNINYYHMGLVHTGGDYMSDGMGVAASTNAVYSVNSANYTPAEVDSIMQLYLGIDDYHVVPNIHGGLSHIDTWAKFLAPNKIMIREVAPTHPYYSHAEQAVEYFESQISSYGTPFQVYRVYTPNNEPYTNSLIVNDRVFVPTTGSNWDDAAVQAFEQAMPGYSVYGVHYNYWHSNDALHCRVKDVADSEMLYIYHQPILEDQQSYNDYHVQVRIIPMSGEAVYEDSLRVYYRVDEGEFSYENMISIGDYWYEAYIPYQEIGAEVSYYIHAADESGRRENHPYMGQYDPHSFNVVGPLVFLGAEFDDSVYGNNNGFFEPGETIEIIANYRNEGEDTVHNLDAQLQTTSQYITIHPPGQVSYPSIEPYEDVEFNFIVSSSLTTPDLYSAMFDIEVLADEGYFSFDSFAFEVNANAIEEYFVVEHFDEWLPDGWEVTSTSGQINWQHSETNLAGGEPPETRFHYNPSTVAIQRLITPSIDTCDYSLIALEFKHYINDYNGGYTLKLETSSDGGNTWTELTTYPDLNMPATTEQLLIDNDDVGSENFRVAWTFDGDSWDINWWHVDDVIIGGVTEYEELAFFEGQVSLNSGYGDVSDVLVSAGNQITTPNEDGFFSLAVLEGSYTVEANLTGYVPLQSEEISIATGETITVDIELEYIAPPVDLTYQLDYYEVNLAWDMYEATGLMQSSNIRLGRTISKRDMMRNDSRPLTSFNIYRSFEEEDFEIIGTTTNLDYTDLVDQGGYYQYYVTAIYDDEYESEPSNTVEIDVVEAFEDLTILTTALKSNYPNPFNPETTIIFSMAQKGLVTIEIFNIRGQKVRTLVEEEFPAGHHSIVWDGKDKRSREVAGGVYLYRFSSGEHTETRKMMLLK